VRWEDVGDPSCPAVVALGGISAGRHVAASTAYADPGWWDTQTAPGAPLDPRRVRLLSIDWLGADGVLDVPIDTTDQAAALATALDARGVRQLVALAGCSYGAQVGFAFATAFPDQLRHLIAISGGCRPHPYAAAYRALQRRVVELGERAGRGSEALAISRGIGMLSYRTPTEFADRFTTAPTIADGRVRVGAEDYVAARGAAYAAAWAPVAFRRLSESIDLHDVDPAAVRSPVTLAAVEGDWLCPPDDLAAFAALIPACPQVTRIHSLYGHDAFLKEPAAIAAVLTEGLAAALAGGAR
jgi:homoserine O-acetyltransferase